MAVDLKEAVKLVKEEASRRDEKYQKIAEAEKAKMDISPSSGEEAQKVADFIVDTPPAVLARAKAILEAPTR